MTIARLQPHYTWLDLDLSVLGRLSEEDFFAFCQANPDLRLERLASGEIIVMAPSGGTSSRRNASLLFQVETWARADGTGVVFDASGGFRLPNGAVRAADVAWVRRDRLAQLTPMQKDRFLPLCPDFVIEVRSPSDTMAELRAKMDEYVSNGARLGWLLDPRRRGVWVYRPGVAAERLNAPVALRGDPELPGFVLDLAPIWDPGF